MSSYRLLVPGSFLLVVSLLSFSQDFESARIVPPSQLPLSMGILAAGDVDGDGIDDLIYTVPTAPNNSGYSSFAIALGSKSGFQMQPAIYAYQLRLATLADINGDGRPDIVGSLTSGPTAQLLVFLNQGGGVLSQPSVTTITTNTNLWPYAQSIAVGDFDGDGKADVIVTTQNGGFFRYHGNGDGTVTAAGTFSGRYLNGYTMTVADLNRDGKLDLVLYIVNAAQVVARIGNGDGTFQPETLVAGGYSYSPMVADFTGDGIPDIAVADLNASDLTMRARLYVGDGNGAFQALSPIQMSTAWGLLMGARDLNGDGKLDLLMGGANGYTVLLGQGGGLFGSPTTYSAPFWGGGGIVGDFDGDGYTDILGVINYSNPINYLLKGFSGGRFEGAATVDFPSKPTGLATSDLNHDGIPDLVASGGGTNVLLGVGDGTFRSQNDNRYIPDQLFLADLDGDNEIDLLAVPSGPYSNMLFRHGNGDGTFADPVTGAGIYHGANNLSLGDLNGDGKLDLAGTTDGYIVTWLGMGDGGFGTENDYFPTSGIYGKIAIADVNGDGVNDVVTVLSKNATVLLGSGDGAGTLTAPTGSYPAATFSMADVNGDGKLDLIAISPDTSTQQINIYLGDGSGQFGIPAVVPVSQSYTGISTSDLNLDGHPDIILTGSRVGVLYNDGRGGFGAEHVLLASDIPTQAVVGDWNQDGAPDIAVINSTGASPSPQSATLFFNRAGSRASLSLSDNPTQYGQPLNVTAAISPTVLGSPVPGGIVHLSIDGVPNLQGSLSDGAYSASVGTLAVGDHLIEGSYAGDGAFIPKTLPSVTATVTKANSSVSLAASSNPAIFGSTVIFSVSVRPPYTGVPTGNVSLWDGTNLIAQHVLDNNAATSFSLSSLSHGNHDFTAKYEGDGNFLNATSPTLRENVLYPSAVTMTSSAENVLVGTRVTLTANVSSSYGTPTGSIAFADNGLLIGNAVVSNGSATLAVSSLAPGVHSIAATYDGDTDFAGSVSAVVAQTVTDFTIVGPTDATLTLNAGASGTLTLNLNPTAGFSGSVVFACSGTPALATCSVSPSPLQINGAAAQAVVTVATTGPNHAALGRGLPSSFGRLELAAALTFGLVGLVSASDRNRKKRRAVLLCVCLLAGISTWSSCGGGGGSTAPPPTQSRTPAGTSYLTVTASTTSGSVVVNHTVTLKLIVN